MKICPTKAQAHFLRETLELANTACNRISEVAWKRRTFGKYALQKLCYRGVKSCFGLSAQMVVRCLAKVGDAYRPDKRSKRRFKPHGSIAYDDPAKRRLKKLSGKEQRFARDTNHVISKEIVEIAERTKRAIALEDLTGIRLRVRA